MFDCWHQWSMWKYQQVPIYQDIRSQGMGTALVRNALGINPDPKFYVLIGKLVEQHRNCKKCFKIQVQVVREYTV